MVRVMLNVNFRSAHESIDTNSILGLREGLPGEVDPNEIQATEREPHELRDIVSMLIRISEVERRQFAFEKGPGP
jgi:hypothetical protein